MRTYEETLDNLHKNSPIVKSKGLNREDINLIVKDLQKEFTKTLLDYGYVYLSEDIKLEVVKLQRRVHVLRGNSYHNWRKYKLKTNSTYAFYLKIEEAFDSLLEENS